MSKHEFLSTLWNPTAEEIDAVNELLDTLLCILEDGFVQEYGVALAAQTRAQFEALDVEFDHEL